MEIIISFLDQRKANEITTHLAMKGDIEKKNIKEIKKHKQRKMSWQLVLGYR